MGRKNGKAASLLFGLKILPLSFSALFAVFFTLLSFWLMELSTKI